MPAEADLRGVPLWDCYVATQAAGASLGLIPAGAIALGVEVFGFHVKLRCQFRVASDEDLEDLGEIVAELAMLDERLVVRSEHEIRDAPRISPDDQVYWFYCINDRVR